MSRLLTIVVAVLTLISCDDEFNSVGSEVIGGVGFEEDIYTSAPIAYNNKLERIQTSGLGRGLVGFYNDPVYGTSEYSLLSQIVPTTFDPDFGKNPVIDSVVLTIPYFSRVIATTIEDNITKNTYELDSVFGSSPISLKLYRSDYFLRDFDPLSEFEERQIYYSDDINNFDEGAVQATEIGTIESFVPSVDEVILPVRDVNGLKSEVDKEKDSILEVRRISPRLRYKLPNELFKDWFIDREGTAELSNFNNFKNYFRGFYIRPELAENSQNGNLFLFDITSTDTNITIFYSVETENADTEDRDQDGDVTELLREQRTFPLRFSGGNLISVNGIKNTFDITIPEPNQLMGDQSLYLKGGEGSYAILELFNRYVETDANGEYVVTDEGDPVFRETPANPTEMDKTELDFLRDQNWLVNNATLKLYVDTEKMSTGGATEPERLFIFDVTTGRGLVDFCRDPTALITDPDNAAIIHLDKLSRGSDGRGEFYELNLTRHVIGLLNEINDSDKLGVTVTQNVLAEIINAERCIFPNTTLLGNEDLDLPVSSVLSPEGTIIYGNIATVPNEKRLQLEIKYSKSIKD